MLAVILGAAVIVGIGVSYYLVRDVSSGIASIVTPMQALGKGDLSAEVPHQGEKTEIGAMADTLQVFKQALIAKKAADEAAAVDAEAKIERGRRVDGITRNFEDVIGEIVADRVVGFDRSSKPPPARCPRRPNARRSSTTTVASASEEASTNVQSVASATEELSSSVNEISRQVQESARMATDAVGQARVTNDRVSELSKAAARIGDVVELINTIAGQTNLLALNATIEAARAGEAGRGFAVVASEVKALAEQTAKATGEIGQQITGIQAATQDSVNAIKEISGTIEKAVGDLLGDRGRRGRAGRGDAGNLPQRAAGRPGHPAGLLQHHRRAARRQRDRRGLLAGALGGAVAVGRQQPPQARGRQVPGVGSRGLTAARRQAKGRLPAGVGLYSRDARIRQICNPSRYSVDSRKRKLTGPGYAAGTFGVARAGCWFRRGATSASGKLRFRKFGVVDMIKLNRIGNKLGLAGAVGVLLAIGMVANQMVTEFEIEEGSERAAPVAAGGRQLALRAYRPAQDSARRQRRQAGENPRRGRKDHCRSAAPQGERSKGTGGGARNRPAAGSQERLQKIKALMDGFTAAVEDLAKAQTTLLAQIDKRSVVSDEWTKSVEAQLSSPAMAKLDNRLEIERLLFQADAR